MKWKIGESCIEKLRDRPTFLGLLSDTNEGFRNNRNQFFSQRYRKFKRRKCSHLPLPPNADRVAKHSHLTSLCWCVLFSVSVFSVGTSWVCYEQCIFVGFSTCVLDIYFLCSSPPWIIWNFVSVFLLLY